MINWFSKKYTGNSCSKNGNVFNRDLASVKCCSTCTSKKKIIKNSPIEKLKHNGIENLHNLGDKKGKKETAKRLRL